MLIRILTSKSSALSLFLLLFQLPLEFPLFFALLISGPKIEKEEALSKKKLQKLNGLVRLQVLTFPEASIVFCSFLEENFFLS